MLKQWIRTELELLDIICSPIVKDYIKSVGVICVYKYYCWVCNVCCIFWVIIDVVACISMYQCISIPRHSPVCRAAAPIPGYFIESPCVHPSPARQHISVSNQGYNYTSHNQSDFINATDNIAIDMYCMILCVCDVQFCSHIKEV